MLLNVSGVKRGVRTIFFHIADPTVKVMLFLTAL